jgi:hypothetical protein
MSPTNVVGGSNPYSCGAPGAKFPRTAMGSCDWNMVPPSDDYHWVSAGGSLCTSTTQCSGSEKCGLSFNPGHDQLLWKTCGSIIGFWSADQVCGISPQYGAPFNCSQSTPEGLTNFNLYGCVGVGSCYQAGADTSCCGCADWDKEGLPVPDSSFTEVCKNYNPTWQERIKPTLQWMKKACPTSYTYPYDDMSSTFTCSNLVNGLSQVDY